MIRLEKHSIMGIIHEYPKIFKEIFPNEQIDCPAEVYLGYEGDKYLGFISGYVQSPSTWYLQRAGFVEKGKLKNLAMHREALAEIHKGFPFIMALVRNDDIPALKMELFSGYKIIGTRMDTERVLWVEMIHSREA